ncbi:hypothetical protein MNBD_ALPHA04-677 [hydrothermal vent metagenome]|uniref:Acetyltransferase n=1 Tax=hydrothermal vent metagenome TaxID=652676 RepID=A0A3B0SII9_9ZZZZ
MKSQSLPIRRRTTLKQRFQRWVQTRIWRMDIHPSAQIATTALIDRTWPKGIHIGKNVIIDEEVVVLTHDLTRGLYLDTNIGENSFVGARAIILPGLNIGDNVIIHPGAMVNRDVANNHQAIGNPAVISPISEQFAGEES